MGCFVRNFDFEVFVFFLCFSEDVLNCNYLLVVMCKTGGRGTCRHRCLGV